MVKWNVFKGPRNVYLGHTIRPILVHCATNVRLTTLLSTPDLPSYGTFNTFLPSFLLLMVELNIDQFIALEHFASLAEVSRSVN